MPKQAKRLMVFSQNVVKMMIANPWLGNIRELENMVERSMLTTKEISSGNGFSESYQLPKYRSGCSG
jgi:DNA-binding NtrC family response regulator